MTRQGKDKNNPLDLMWCAFYCSKMSQVEKGNGVATTTYVSKYYDVASDGTISKHIYEGDILVVTIETDGASTTTNYIHTDHLGGTSVVTDEEGGVVQVFDYYPFGGVRTDEQYAGLDEGRKYIGETYDEETELSYLNI
ncbi:MAG: YD repeat-containing protein [Parcubacteria group bacterium GW2011_GWA2_43_11]|nr:MAG: YD repeat-containing protein [Parcubacteria group bacterium GW2011_GWA2_43_11]